MFKENTMVFKNALISLSDKTDALDFTRELTKLNIDILSTGGTYKLLQENNIAVRSIADYTAQQEILDGRVKSLHPKIHGGILARRGIDDAILIEQNIETIDIVVVNLYPFVETLKNKHASHADIIENIDIGGPTMVRAAAKNYKDVVVIVDHNDYTPVIDEIKKSNNISLEKRLQLANKAFATIADYDIQIANYFAQLNNNKTQFHNHLFLSLSKANDLPYGENPHQLAGLYTTNSANDVPSFNPALAKQLQGKPLSYNNLNDTHAAFMCVTSFQEPACVIVKHANPCGVAVSDTVLQAYVSAYATDSTSAFGGIIAFNREVNLELIKNIINNQFFEVLIATGISDDAQQLLLAKKPNVRLLIYPDTTNVQQNVINIKSLGNSAFLVQQADNLNSDNMECVTQRQPTNKELTDLSFAWKVATFVKSNAIVYAKNSCTIGIGAGQMSRVDSANIAIIKAKKANLNITSSVMASDAFFPFRDSVDAAEKAGITAIIHPGGSIRDSEVIDAANENNIAMLFTATRHFLH
jgi:phosphoribosylaminoimidazolecarboxamide formyltransferase / IMP cyclohydrolase